MGIKRPKWDCTPARYSSGSIGFLEGCCKHGWREIRHSSLKAIGSIPIATFLSHHSLQPERVVCLIANPVGLFFGIAMLPITSSQFGALLLALALAGTHFAAYRTGKKLVEGDWAQERAEVAQRVADEATAARAKEQELTKKANDVQAKLNAEKKRAVAAASAAADELRLLQEALAASGAAKDSTSTTGANGASPSELLVQCAGVHQVMAAEADSLANKVTGLQGYVNDVCLSRSSGK